MALDPPFYYIQGSGSFFFLLGSGVVAILTYNKQGVLN